MLRLRDRSLNVSGVPLVMGILNVTPDSFSDGGDYLDVSAATSRALKMIAEGADIIDVGPESTRPGAVNVPADEQTARALPVIRAIREHDSRVVISIDTRLASVANTALDAGADMINDVSALQDDPAMLDVVSSSGAAVVLMHRRGTSATMQNGGGPHYDDVINEIITFLMNRVRAATEQGIDPSRIIVDPGLGFGKKIEDNLTILRHLDRFIDLGYPVLVGASRKRFLGSVLGVDNPVHRDAGSLACAVMAAMAGVAVVRVHDVRPAVEAIKVCAAVQRGQVPA